MTIALKHPRADFHRSNKKGDAIGIPFFIHVRCVVALQDLLMVTGIISRSSAYKLRLHFQLHTKPGQDVPLNIPRQRHDVCAPGATIIDQHQGLLPMHPDADLTMPLPSSLLYEPASSQLYAAIRLRVMRQV